MTRLTKFIIAIGLSVCIALGVFFISLNLQKKDHTTSVSHKESLNPTFTVYNLNNRFLTLSTYAGKLVFVNFWASWCAPCIEEIPSLNNLTKSFSNQLVVLAVSNETLKDIKMFLKAFPQLSTNFIPSYISRKNMLKSFPVTAFPETYIFNKRGKLIEKVIGPQKWDSTYWKEKVKQWVLSE